MNGPGEGADLDHGRVLEQPAAQPPPTYDDVFGFFAGLPVKTDAPADLPRVARAHLSAPG